MKTLFACIRKWLDQYKYNSVKPTTFDRLETSFQAMLNFCEALALEWTDVLWNRRALRVSKTLIRLANSHRMEVQNDAKSFSSNRTIPLNKEAMRLLNDLHGAV